MPCIFHDAAFKSFPFRVMHDLISDGDVVDAFQAWYAANVRQIARPAAGMVLKAFTAVYHFEQAVGEGMFKLTVRDIAKDVVSRLENFDEMRDVEGLCCAVDMFLATWENHHHQPSSDYMARVIQIRFWFSYARWNTMPRLSRFFRNQRFSVDVFRNMPFRNCVQVATNLKLNDRFGCWIKRMVYVANSQKKDDDSEHFAYSDDVMGFRMARLAILAHTHLAETITLTGMPSERLSGPAAVLAPLLDTCMAGDMSVARDMLRAFQAFATAHQAWWSVQKNVIMPDLQHQIYNRAFVFERGSGFQREILEMLQCQYVILTSSSEAAEFFNRSPQMRALRESKTTGLWENVLTFEEMMHELLLDPDFQLSAGQCYVTVSKRYHENMPASISSELFLPMLTDIQGAAIRCCFFAQDAFGVVSAFQLDRVREDRSFLDRGFADYAGQIILNHLVVLFRNATRAGTWRMAWADMQADHDNVARVMSLMWECALDLRVCEENFSIDKSKTIHWVERRAVLSRKPKTTVNTIAWLKECLDRVDDSSMRLLVAGEPFVIMRFHDTALVDLVWDNTRMSPALLPEILDMDVARLQEVRDLIEGMPDSVESRRVFAEVMISDKVPRNARFAPPASFMTAARKLRKVMQGCRIVHGDTTAAIFGDLASRRWGVMRGLVAAAGRAEHHAVGF